MNHFKAITGVTTHRDIIDFINDIVDHHNDVVEELGDLWEYVDEQDKKILDYVDKKDKDLQDQIDNIPDIIEDHIAAHKPNIKWDKVNITDNLKLVGGTVETIGDEYNLNINLPYNTDTCDCTISNIQFKYEDGKIWVSWDNGQTWHDLDSTLPESPEGLHFSIKFKIEEEFIYVSYDGGDTWILLGECKTIVREPADLSRLSFKIEGQDLYYSITDGQSFVKLGKVVGDNGKDGQNGSDGQGGSVDWSKLKFKIDGNILYYSTNGGSSWDTIGSVSGGDGSSSSDVDLTKIKLKIEDGQLKISYNGGTDYTTVGNIGGAGSSSGGEFDLSKVAIFTNDEDTNGSIDSGAVRVSGGVSIGKRLWVKNGIWSDGFVSSLGNASTSDERLKDIIGSITLDTDIIAKAPSIKFNWKNKDIQSVGSIAQYWAEILPDAVHTDDDGFYSMEYGNIALISAISLAREVIELKKRISELEDKEN